jgi:hypothetical protein
MLDITHTIEQKRFITQKKLKTLIQEYQKKTGIVSNPEQIEIFIKILDINSNFRNNLIRQQED